MSKQQVQRRVGASVAIEGNTPIGIPPPGPYPGILPIVPPFGYGCEDYCRPPPFFGRGCNIIDERNIHHHERERRRDNVLVSATILSGQTILGGSTQQIALGSSIITIGGNVSGSSLILLEAGVYRVDITVVVNRPITSASGTVLFSLNGTTILAGGTVNSGETEVFSGSTIIQTASRNSSVSFTVSNTTALAGPITLQSGNVSAQLIIQSRDFE